MGAILCRFRDIENQVRRKELRRQRLEWFRIIYTDEKRVEDGLRTTADAATHSHEEWVDIVNDLIRSSAGVDLVEAGINPADLRRIYACGYSSAQAVSLLLDQEYDLS